VQRAKIRRRALAAWLLVATLVPAAGAAQGVGGVQPSQVRRPYRGIFSPPGDRPGPHSLIFTASAIEGYDNNVLGALAGRERRPIRDPRLQGSGTYSAADTGLVYDFSPATKRATFNATSSVQVRYYHTDRWNITPHYHGAANLSLPIANSTTLNAGYSFTVARNQRFLLFPDATGAEDDGAAEGDPDNELFRRSSMRHSAQLGVSRRLSSRSSLSATYAIRYVDFLDADVQSLRRQTGSLQFDRRLTSHATFKLGYGYTVVEPRGNEESRRIQHFDGGIAYSRALSFSRRTSIGFSTGSAFVARDNLADGDQSFRGRFRALGSATLTHEIARTWTATLAYNRRLLFREGFADPFFTDGVTGTINGLVTRRFDVSGRVSRSWATYEGRRGGHHDSTWATAQARYALGASVAAFARYVYYTYSFSDEIPLDPEMPGLLDRQGVKVGITLSVPLIR
jgi:hypothetical protein